MGKLVLLPQTIAPAGEEYLLRNGYDLRHGSGIDTPTLKAEIAGCHAVLVRTAVMSDEVMVAANQLKVIAKHGAGVDNIDVEAATRRGICVTNAPMGMTCAVAEYTVGMMLALAKKFLPCDAAFRSTGDFSLRHAFHLVEMAGKTAGVVGMGRIGSAVARRLAAFDMQVLGYDPHLPPSQWPQGVIHTNSLEEMLPLCDFVTLHVPLMPATRHLISATLIGLMKPAAFFINAARGEIVDEQALIRALSEGKLAGAGLDVFEQEPPSTKHPFFHMPNVIVSPHNSALTPEASIRMAVDAAVGIHQVLSGQPVTWPVNACAREVNA